MIYLIFQKIVNYEEIYQRMLNIKMYFLNNFKILYSLD